MQKVTAGQFLTKWRRLSSIYLSSATVAYNTFFFAMFSWRYNKTQQNIN